MVIPLFQSGHENSLFEFGPQGDPGASEKACPTEDETKLYGELEMKIYW
jgi:hypothetical protein